MSDVAYNNKYKHFSDWLILNLIFTNQSSSFAMHANNFWTDENENEYSGLENI